MTLVACFALLLKIGRWISNRVMFHPMRARAWVIILMPDTTRLILYHVMCFVQ